MWSSSLSDLQPVYVLQFFSKLPVSLSYFLYQFCDILFHLLPCGTVAFPVCNRHPVIILSEIPFDQPPEVPLSFPLVLSFYILRRSFLFLFSLLSPGAIPSCMLFFYLYGFSTVPQMSYVRTFHISPGPISNTPYQAGKGTCTPKINTGFSPVSLTFSVPDVIVLIRTFTSGTYSLASALQCTGFFIFRSPLRLRTPPARTGLPSEASLPGFSTARSAGLPCQWL